MVNKIFDIFFKSFCKGVGIFLMIGGFSASIIKLILEQGVINVFIGTVFSVIGLIIYIIGDVSLGVNE